ncbi:MAG: NUDIX domain-containing protein [Bacilli bacterium]|nr:NUDIX domain-containing protein [Bacilli bacterium]
MEYLDLYDENKKLTGKKILRNKKGYNLEKGTYINIVVVYIENNEGKFLIQKTSKEKGSIWATTGGHVKSGQTCDESIIEEIKEELGIYININELKHIMIDKREFAFQDVYYLKKDINVNDLTLQNEEVEFVKWLSVEEINKLIDNDEFRIGNIKSFKYLLDNKENICKKN